MNYRHVYDQMGYPIFPIQLPPAKIQDPPLSAVPTTRPSIPENQASGSTQLLCHPGPPSPGFYQNTLPASEKIRTTRPRTKRPLLAETPGTRENIKMKNEK